MGVLIIDRCRYYLSRVGDADGNTRPEVYNSNTIPGPAGQLLIVRKYEHTI